MAIAAEVDFPGATTAQYDEAIKEMGLSPGSPHPGALFHWVTETDSGLRVTDVWASKEDFERFVQEEVVPASQKVGLPAPEVRIVEVHNYMVGG